MDPDELVETALEISKPRWQSASAAHGYSIRARKDLACGDARVYGVESELRQALLNLIINAADAMTLGGTLTLSTAVVASTEGEPDTVEIRVTDTGVGMDEDTSASALEPYFTTKQTSGGTGLGLASVHATVERHGGRVSIDSTLGQGTTVTISLPRHSDEEATETAVTRNAAGRFKPARVLCIDDDPRLCSLLLELVGALGHHVDVAEGGAAGCDLFDPDQHDIVITDLGMPGVSGRAVAEHVKRRSPTTPVVLLTGWGHQLIDTRRTPPGVDVVLSKPPSVDHLRSTIERLSRGPGTGTAR